MRDLLQKVHPELAITSQFQQVSDQKSKSVLMGLCNE